MINELPVQAYIPLGADDPDFDLDLTFASGQAFRWKQIGPQDWWGLIGDKPVRLLKKEGIIVIHGAGPAVLPPVTTFLKPHVSLSRVRASCADLCPEVMPLFDQYRGLRVLEQEPVECLLSFTCAVATNIKRIKTSIEALCDKFGKEIAPGIRAFPDLEILAGVDEEELRVGQMAFRCRSLSRAARELQIRGGGNYLDSLRGMTYERAAEELTTIPHIGPKVADCVLLFSLGFDESIPLDTHIWRSVSELFQLPPLSRTPAAYRRTSEDIRKRLGPWTGWVQQYLYVHSLWKGENKK